MNAIDIARYIVQKNAEEDNAITNLKLQKILYYVQGYSFKQLGEAAFDDPIYKWPYGPVVPTVYFAYNSNRARKIYDMDDTTAQPVGVIRAFDGLKMLVDRVDDACQTRSSTELVSMTHQERPWLDAMESKEICPEAIQSYFERNDPLRINLES